MGNETSEIGNVCDNCGKWIDVSSEGILTDSGELLCIKCQAERDYLAELAEQECIEENEQ